jgi:hypothetical protein
VLDEIGLCVDDHIIEDEDQGFSKSKEWGPMGWYCHLLEDGKAKASNGKTIYLLPLVPV